MKDHGARFQPALGGTLHLGRTNAFFLGGGKALMNTYYQAAGRRGIRILYNAEVVAMKLERGAFESDLLPVVEQFGIGVIPYFSLAAGFLTGKYRSKQDAAGKARGAMVEKYLNDHGFAVLDALDAVAAELHSTPARVALAWLIAKPGVTAPIASATSLDHLKDLAESTQLKLPPAAIAKLDAASSPAQKAA